MKDTLGKRCRFSWSRKYDLPRSALLSSRSFAAPGSSGDTKSPLSRTAMKSEQIKQITDRAAEHLVAALQAGHSEALTAYLKAIGRFHRYSLHNVLLIASQRPNASYVAGFRTWNELGRFVKKGEKGIMILAPIVRRKTDDQEDCEETSHSITGFR